MSTDDTGLLIVDAQERILPLVRDHERVTWNMRRLLEGAAALGVRAAATEQYPKRLGPTVPELAARLADVMQGQAASKMTFSGGGCSEIFDAWREQGIHRVLLAGIETHVCIQQTALDLLAAGFGVYVAVDAVSARWAIDHATALRRIDSAGATLTTAESALCEWCETADTPRFKMISELLKQSPPHRPLAS